MSRKLISMFMVLAMAAVCLLAGCEKDEIHVHREVTVQDQMVDQHTVAE